MERNYISLMFNGFVDEHFLPFKVGDTPIVPFSGTQSGREDEHRVRAGEGFVDRVGRVAVLASVFVDGEEQLPEGFDGHKEVVDNEVKSWPVDLTEPVEINDTVECTEGMIGDEYDTLVLRRGEEFGITYVAGHVEIVEHAPTEVTSAPPVVGAQEVVEAVLTDGLLYPPDKPMGYVFIVAGKSPAYYLVNVYLHVR